MKDREDFGLQRDRLLEDMRAVARDAQALLDATADVATEQVREARSQASVSLGRIAAAITSDDARSRARQFATQTGTYVREHPWQLLLAAAAGAAVVTAAVAARRLPDTTPTVN